MELAKGLASWSVGGFLHGNPTHSGASSGAADAVEARQAVSDVKARLNASCVVLSLYYCWEILNSS